jgi:hypothetical protein
MKCAQSIPKLETITISFVLKSEQTLKKSISCQFLNLTDKYKC